jgi:hypothetical protein
VQLVQAELDRVNSDIVLNWELIDALGWVLPANSLSYSNLTPIAAIKLSLMLQVVLCIASLIAIH